MIEAGVDALFLSRVEAEIETMEDCRETVRCVLLAGLRSSLFPVSTYGP